MNNVQLLPLRKVGTMRKTLCLLFYFLILFSFALPSSTVLAAEKRFDIPLNQSPQFGPQDAPVTIIEFVDFQ